MAKRKNNFLQMALPLAGLPALWWFSHPALKTPMIVVAGCLILVGIGFICYRFFSQTREKTPSFGSDTGYSRPCSHVAQSRAATVLPAAPPVVSILERLRAIDWFQFEQLVETIYREKNFTVQRFGGANPDGGIDLMAENAGGKFAIQCKQWKTWKVGVAPIREFLGALKDSGTDQGIFITLHGYSDDARRLATKHGIELIGEKELIASLEELNWRVNPAFLKVLESEDKHCPKCESRMVLRTTKKGKNEGGKFWGCSTFPKCRFVFSV